MHDRHFYRGDTRSVLDVVLMSGELCVGNVKPQCSVQTCDYTSHHRRVVITTVISRTRVKPMYRTGRNWRALNPENFIGDVRATDWTTVVRQDDPCERQWERFSTEMNRILDIHVPVRRFRVHNPAPPPVSDDTLDLMQQRREAKNSGNTNLYNELNATVKRAIRDECRNTISQRVINSHPSTLYRQLQPIISSKRGSSTQPVNLTPDELNTYLPL